MAKLPVTSVGAIADPGAFKDQMWRLTILPTLSTGQAFGFEKQNRKKKKEKTFSAWLIEKNVMSICNKEYNMENMNFISLKINFIYSSYNKIQSI